MVDTAGLHVKMLELEGRLAHLDLVFPRANDDF